MGPRHSLGSRRGQANSSEAGTRRHKPDYWLLVLTALLLGVGLVVVYSISPGLAASQHISQNYFITKQLIAVLLGLFAFVAAYYTPVKAWLKFAIPLILLAVICSVAAIVSPVDAVHNAHRWVRLGGFSFQAVEIIKLAILVWLAAFLGRQWKSGQLDDFKATLQPLLLLLAIIAVVVAKLQSDLGSAGVIIVMMGVMAYVGGVPIKRIAMFAGIVAVVAVLAISSSGYRRERLATYLHPESNCLTTGYQACQSLISVGSGGVFGLGLGYSVQAYGYQPEASNDSIFAIMAEKFGFVGTFAIITVYGLLLARLKRIITRTSDQFSRLLVVGVMGWISTQVIINVGAMIGLLPLKGITLPLISQGGTSLVFLAAALGLVFQISRYTSYNAQEPSFSLAESRSNGYSFDGGRVRRPHNAPLVARPRA